MTNSVEYEGCLIDKLYKNFIIWFVFNFNKNKMTKEYQSKKYVKYIQIQIACPNDEIADRIANYLVANKIVACIQIIPMSKSMYLWNWQIEIENEILLVAKTRWKYFSKIEKIVKEIHSSHNPEIIALPIVKISDDYALKIDEALWLKTIDFEDNKTISDNK